MAKILVVYGTTEGHTRKISSQVTLWSQAEGHEADLMDTANLPDDLDLALYDAFILAGSLHEGKHQKALVHFAKAHAAELSGVPSAFLSASLTAVNRDEKHQADAQRCIDEFTANTGWIPSATKPVAGALLYSQYDWLKRTVMKMIAAKEGGATDTSQDYEYTDWVKLKEFVVGFLADVVARPHAQVREPARIEK